MSTNASSFRRILRSIGSHATPPTSTLRTSSASVHPPIPRCRRYSAHAPQHNEESHATTEDVPIQKIEQEPPSWQVGGPGESVQHIGSRHSSTPSQPIKHSDLSEPKVAESHLSRRQPFEPKVKDENTFRKQYFETVKSENKTRLKESARRRQLSAERHLYPEDKAWADIWKALEKNSSSDATSYVKRMETIRWPKGIFAKWSGDPAEAILEVMQRTGSHVQVVPGKRPGLFSSITLLGTPSENAAATKLLRESDLLRAVSHDDPNASTSLAEYQLSSEVSTVKTRPDDEGTKIPTSDRTDERGSAHIQKLMSDITGVVPTRAVWSRDPRPVEEQDIELSEHEGQDDLLASKSALPMSAVAFTRRVEKLTERQPRQFGSTDNESVKEQLVALMTNPNLAIFITPAALRATMRYFTANGFYPAARVVLNALKDAKVHIDADVFNVLLHAAAKDVNVLAFHYIVHIMRDRGVLMNAGTWVAFHTLTLKRFPEDAGKVVSQMTAKSVQASAEAKSDIPESYAATFLDSFLDRHPAASMVDFFEHMKREVSSTRWLTTFSANTMCAILLKRGKTFAAFEVVDELVRRGGRPDTVTLNTFLSAAKRAGDMEMAVALLRKFHDLHAKSIALACKEDEKPTIGSRKHDLSVNLNRISYKMLFTIAWQQRNYNCLRVFWRYACCAGLVDPLIRQNMDQSAAFDGHDTDGTLGPHARIRLVCASRFAMGVRAGLDDAQAAKVLSAARGVRHVSDTTPLASVQGLLSKAKPLSERGGPKKRLAIIAVDESEVGKLRPTRPLVELAEQALREDRSWKDAMLGNPNAQDKYGSAEEMLEVMLKTGIQVPMKEGKLRRLRL